MAGETSIEVLLRNMRPTLNEGEFVFCTVPDISVLQGTEVIGTFREQEGLTVIIERAHADALGLEYSFVSAWITLTVHSALDAVGLTAAFATALGNAGISCNVVAGYYHDHIFVGLEYAAKAMQVLQALSRSGSAE
ncbi:ACT domain-containing protein [Pseudomonas sp. PSKL.D1]|uniref:ACT domain-containing protein n=1 Tax=Pseudomonas sp. PSKL.D1 TaxID=3029060 RepID=UPI002381200E|nr:ACT domain-containing protein [Pseudomonas sp. PSKL.D1]WDY60458.1 ACT domain-containing protein [Pseudomonas sp. PSKL.D1]